MLTVALIGPDGAGKTAISALLEEELGLPVKSIYMGVNLHSGSVLLPHTRVLRRIRRWTRRNSPAALSDIRVHRPPPRSAVVRFGSAARSWLRVANWIAEESYRQSVAGYHTRQGTIVVFDRHFFADFYSEELRLNGVKRPLARRFHSFFLKNFYPMPDLLIFLDAPAELLHARKPEGSLERLQAKREGFLILMKELPEAIVVDASLPLEETTRQVANLIRDSYEQRSQGRRAAIRTSRRSAGPIGRDSLREVEAVPTSPPPAVVVGLDCITGLQTARILARHGIPVFGVARDLGHFCCRTRACEAIVQANTSGDELVGALEALSAKLGQKAVLFPCTDVSVLIISRNRGRLENGYHIALPNEDVLELLIDKARFSTYATEHGLPIPRTELLESRRDAEAAAASLSFPCMIKPPLKTPAWERDSRAKVYKVRSPDELLAVYDEVAPSSSLLLAQEWIDGTEGDHFTCNCYFDRESRPIVTFVTRKIRQWPPQTGAASLAVECRNDEVLGETIRLFTGVGYWGLAYLEMKRSAQTGGHFIIEPNVGRPTGRSASAEATGVELLYAMYCDVLGLPLPEGHLVQRYGGAKWIYFGRDVRSAFSSWRQGELTAREWARSLRGPKVDAVFSWRDPLPFLIDTLRVTALVRRSRSR